MDPTLNHTYWDLACDIAVEHVITELGLKAVTTARERQQAQYITTYFCPSLRAEFGS